MLNSLLRVLADSPVQADDVVLHTVFVYMLLISKDSQPLIPCRNAFMIPLLNENQNYSTKGYTIRLDPSQLGSKPRYCIFLGLFTC